MKKSLPLEVKCPCCESVLVIDPQTGVVLEHKKHDAPSKVNLGFDDYLEEQKNMTSKLEQKMAAAKEAEKNRLKALEEKFKLAQNKNQSPPTERPNGAMWD